MSVCQTIRKTWRRKFIFAHAVSRETAQVHIWTPWTMKVIGSRSRSRSHKQNRSYCRLKFYNAPIAVIGIFNLFLAGPWPWPDDLHIRTWPGWAKMNVLRTQSVRKLSSDRHTEINFVGGRLLLVPLLEPLHLRHPSRTSTSTANHSTKGYVETREGSSHYWLSNPTGDTPAAYGSMLSRPIGLRPRNVTMY